MERVKKKKKKEKESRNERDGKKEEKGKGRKVKKKRKSRKMKKKDGKADGYSIRFAKLMFANFVSIERHKSLKNTPCFQNSA